MRIFSCYIFILISFACFSQKQGRISYRITTDNSYLESESYKGKDGFKQMMRSLDEIRDSISFFLDFNESKSIFYVDTKTNIGLSNKRGYKSTLKTFNTYYRDDNSKKLVRVVNSEKIYLVDSDYNAIVWKITNKKKKIGKYTCINATAAVTDKTPTKGLHKRLVEAWFCPELSIRLGPNNYGGLPGLIMELKERKFTYYVNSIDLKYNPKIEIKEPKKGTKIIDEEYFKLIPTITRENIKEYIGGN